MISKSMKTFMVAALMIMSWTFFYSEESLADKEPECMLSTSEYTENVKDYKGTVVLVDGIITNMGFVDNGLRVDLDNEVTCYFREDEAMYALDSMSVGDWVAIKGKGNGVNTFGGNDELNYCTVKL